MNYLVDPFEGDEDNKYIFEFEKSDLVNNEKIRLDEV